MATSVVEECPQVASDLMRTAVLLEICVDSVESAAIALSGGAHRLELCSGLGEGGLTPTAGFVRAVRQLRRGRKVALMCLIRCRAGGFVYSPDEVRLMRDDIGVLRDAGADGFVIGALTDKGDINVEVCQQLREVCGNLPVTFHRAFDYCKEPFPAVITKLKQIGCNRLLTSGREANVVAGLDALKELCRLGLEERVIVVPGGGVRVENISLLRECVKPSEIHMSASREVENVPGMGVRRIVDANLVRDAISALQ